MPAHPFAGTETPAQSLKDGPTSPSSTSTPLFAVTACTRASTSSCTGSSVVCAPICFARSRALRVRLDRDDVRGAARFRHRYRKQPDRPTPPSPPRSAPQSLRKAPCARHCRTDHKASQSRAECGHRASRYSPPERAHSPQTPHPHPRPGSSRTGIRGPDRCGTANNVRRPHAFPPKRNRPP